MTSRQALTLLQRYESPNITFIAPDGSWPIVWERAKGVHVWDAEGRRYLDLTGAFGVAAAGHANPRVIKAAQQQMHRLLHAMGDVHPHSLKGQLARELSRLTFERWNRGAHGKTIFCNSGFEAVEAALKTALLATGRPGVIAFRGAYHGVGYGTLNVTERRHFRRPFLSQLRQFGHFVCFPTSEEPRSMARCERELSHLFRAKKIGAILFEPVQVRGGIRIPPPNFLPLTRKLCDQHGALLIADEIYTGFGRTGKWFACEHAAIAPDLICLGKALTGGFPLSACVGRADLIDAAWPAATGEAIHTSTFLAHPVGCAMALANIKEIRSRKLIHRSASLGTFLLRRLKQLKLSRADLRLTIRSSGLLAGIEPKYADGSPATAATLELVKRLLHRGYIFLPEGEHSNVISFSPPLTISEAQLATAVEALDQTLDEVSRR